MPLLRWLNAGFLILAACRALVPGLCATQLAAGDAEEYRAAHSCCSTRVASKGEERPGVRVPLPERAPCGFCSLMQGMLDPLEHACVCPSGQVRQGAAMEPMRPIIATTTMPHHGRAPPFSG